MENLKKLLQNIWENLAWQSKILLKSSSVSNNIQILLLLIPMLLWLFSFYFNGIKLLDYISYFISILAIIYYTYFWRNTEFYRSYWEKYLFLYKEVESYYKLKKSIYDKEDILKFRKLEGELNLDLNKPFAHPFIKWLVSKTIEKEIKYSNEEKLWWEE